MAEMREPVQIIGQGGSYADALASVLDQLCRLLGPGKTPADDDRSVRLRAEADTLSVLAADMINALIGAVQDHEALPTSVIFDGFRAIEEGYRVWATASLSQSSRDTPVARIAMGPDVHEDVTGWSLSVGILVE